MKIAALIPCKKGSKGVPDKNFKHISGKVMYQWTLDAARESGIFDIIVLSSNGGFEHDGMIGNEFYRNDEPEPGDVSSLDSLLRYYVEKFPDVAIWCLLQPTSALRTSDDIKESFRIFLDNEFDSVLSVQSMGDKYWIQERFTSQLRPLYDPENRMMRQNQKTNVVFYENGAIYITKKWVLEQKSCRIGGRIGFYEMPQERSWQIDSPFDWEICEAFLGKSKSHS
jgi:CMP-N,N'-diacetyllegionaminic acid synthase